MTFLEIFADDRGTLGSIEFNNLPFAPKRFYWIVMSNEEVRGRHAHRTLDQIIFVQEGVIEFKINSGNSQSSRVLRQGEYIHLGPAIWREFKCLTKSGVLGCLASEVYDESDYVRDFDAFLELNNEVL
jgi:hypothetical protein